MVVYCLLKARDRLKLVQTFVIFFTLFLTNTTRVKINIIWGLKVKHLSKTHKQMHKYFRTISSYIEFVCATNSARYLGIRELGKIFHYDAHSEENCFYVGLINPTSAKPNEKLIVKLFSKTIQRHNNCSQILK